MPFAIEILDESLTMKEWIDILPLARNDNLSCLVDDSIFSIDIFDPSSQGMDPEEGIPAAYRKAKEAMEKAGL